MLPTPKNLSFNPKWTSVTTQRFPNEVKDVITFTPSHTHGLRGSAFDTLLDELMPDLTNRNKQVRSQALQSALLCLAQCLVHTDRLTSACFIHSRSNTRSKVITRYKTCDFSGPVFTKVLDRLYEYGFAVYNNGFRGEGFTKGLATIWEPTERFACWFDKAYATLTLTPFYEDRELVILRDSKKKLVDYTDTELTQAMRHRLKASNEVRQRHTWRYIPLDKSYYVLDRSTPSKPKKRYTGYVEGVLPFKVISPEDLECCRIFNDTFDIAGRFYCKAQNLMKEERATLTIDGEPTVEIDLKSLHPRMLYNLNGIEAPSDCYASDSQDERRLKKEVSMVVINCESQDEAKQALMSNQHMSSQKAQEAIETFVKSHTPIAHCFFNKAWGKLQRLDSEMTDIVLDKCTLKGIPVLPIHDSYVVSTRHAFEVEDIIRKAYQSVCSFEPVLEYVC